MADTLTVKHNRHDVEIAAPAAPSPGGTITVVCPKDGETFLVENPAGDSDQEEA